MMGMARTETVDRQLDFCLSTSIIYAQRHTAGS